ncbi:MAG: F0F1 ATP synthase subunit alpha, partial [Anaerolineales bacterium]|nr:F0F1 ATP synthase subunit alpha [Anaerolineales bacterium]
QAQLNRGLHLQEILKQAQYEPMSLEHQVIVLFAGAQGFTDKVPLDQMKRWEADLLKSIEASNPEIGKDVAQKRIISDETRAKLTAALEAFNVTWQ